MRPSSLHLRSIGASRLAASSCRPISFFAPAEKAKETNKELSERLFVQVKSLHESTLQPLNQRWLGPLEKAGSELIPLPMVFVLGNHSSGKSTFLNHVVGRKIQESGVAPTDDGFTIIARGTRDVDQDGPALVGDKDLGFGGLRSFGTAFVNHLSLKLRTDLAIDGIAMVDTPGMIDSPLTASSSSSFTSSSTDFSALGARVIAGGSSGSGSGADSKATQMLSSERGYDFQGVVRWFAQRADLILLFFDPEKPGTTGETLSILTSSLVGEENKLIFVLNKADTFARTHDFARAYGALSWNLSKVIPRKDLPRIATMRVPIGKGKADDAAAGTAANAGFLKDTLPDLDATLQEVSFIDSRQWFLFFVPASLLSPCSVVLLPPSSDHRRGSSHSPAPRRQLDLPRLRLRSLAPYARHCAAGREEGVSEGDDEDDRRRRNGRSVPWRPVGNAYDDGGCGGRRASCWLNGHRIRCRLVLRAEASRACCRPAYRRLGA